MFIYLIKNNITYIYWWGKVGRNGARWGQNCNYILGCNYWACTESFIVVYWGIGNRL